MNRRRIQHILLPIDDSPGTEQALDYAALLATALGASVTLIRVDELPRAMVGLVPGASEEGDLAAEHRASFAALTALAAGLAARGVAKVETRCVAAPSIAPALLHAARTGGVDLIVMGTHARTGMSRFLLGSIAEEVLRRAPCPVLTVHLPPEP